MKRILSFIFCCLCFISFSAVTATAAEMQLQTENIPDDVKISLTEAYRKSKAISPAGRIAFMNEAELIGTSNFGDNIMGGMFSDGSFVLTGTGHMTYRPSDIYDDFITSVYVDSGITSLYDECFKDCSALEYVYIMGTVSDMGDSTFENCNALHTIVLEEGLTAMGDRTFAECKNIQNLKLPSTIQLNNTAFAGCTSLVTAGPQNGSFIVEFSWNSTIPDNAFAGMYYLQDVTIPDGITEIGSYAFGDCISLSLVCIPETVKNIAPTAFYNMQEISWVYYAGSQTRWDKITIADGNDRLKNAYFYYNTIPQVTVNTSYNHTPEISWEAVPFALGYEVFYALDAGSYYEFLTSVTHPAVSVTHTTAVENETYHYVVRALMPENRYADFSKDVEYTVPDANPVITIELTANGKPVISWTPVKNAGKYELYRSTAEDGTYTRLITTTKTSVTNSGAVSGKTYYYKVRPVSSVDIAGNFSDTVSVTIPHILSAPKISVELTDDIRPVISWDAVEYAEEYEIYCSSSEDGQYTKIATTDKTSIIADNAEYGAINYYKVKSISSYDIDSSLSAVADIYVPAIPETPSLDIILNSNGKPVISWNSVDHAVKYELYRSVSKNGNYTRLITTVKNKIINTGVSENTIYYYKVRAISAEGIYSRYSDIKSVTVPPPIGVPVVKVTLNASGKPVISWNSIANAEKYELYRSASADGKYSRLITTVKTSITNSGAVADNTYYYKVRALKSDGTAGNFSNIVHIYIPDNSSDLNIEISLNSSGKPVIKWNSFENAAKYQVFRSDSENGTYSKLITTVKTSVTNTGALPGKTYYYKINALDANGKIIGSSNIRSVNISAELSVPQTTITLNNAGKPVISWNSVAGAEKYQLYRCVAENGNYTCLITTVKNSVTNFGTVSGNTYYYKVKALDANGNTIGFSNICSVVSG